MVRDVTCSTNKYTYIFDHLRLFSYMHVSNYEIIKPFFAKCFQYLPEYTFFCVIKAFCRGRQAPLMRRFIADYGWYNTSSDLEVNGLYVDFSCWQLLRQYVKDNVEENIEMVIEKNNYLDPRIFLEFYEKRLLDQKAIEKLAAVAVRNAHLDMIETILANVSSETSLSFLYMTAVRYGCIDTYRKLREYMVPFPTDPWSCDVSPWPMPERRAVVHMLLLDGFRTSVSNSVFVECLAYLMTPEYFDTLITYVRGIQTVADRALVVSRDLAFLIKERGLANYFTHLERQFAIDRLIACICDRGAAETV